MVSNNSNDDDNYDRGDVSNMKRTMIVVAATVTEIVVIFISIKLSILGPTC